MKYGFITFDKAENAYTAIDSGSKDSKLQQYDISFGGRRAFCRQNYADLGENYLNQMCFKKKHLIIPFTSAKGSLFHQE